MAHPLNLPNMVEHVLLEGQGWSPDHLAWLPLVFILAWDSEVEGPKIYDACSGNIYFMKINWKKWKVNVGNAAKTVTIVGTCKWIDLYIFVKVCYYPLLPLAGTSIEASLRLMYCLLLYIVDGYPLSFNLFFLFDSKDTNVQSYGL